MPSKNTTYQCSACGQVSSSWFGKCLTCGEWNTLVAKENEVEQKKGFRKAIPAESKELKDIKSETINRKSSGIDEFDRVLGGGIVSDEVILLSGEPGVGKSTLVLKIISNFRCLYVAGEESTTQISARATRLGVNPEAISITETNDVDRLVALLDSEKNHFELVIVDSIQTIFTNDVPSTAGSQAQIRESLSRLVKIAKKKKIALIIIGHITKDGEIAGPKTLEHYVDAVFFLEGERDSAHRVLRAFKNRFGAVDEIGVFEMGEGGLKEKPDPLGFLSDAPLGEPGSALIGIAEGSRVFFYEVQALVVPSNLPMPRRVVVGLDFNRVQLLLAITRKYLKVNLDSYDVYISVAGGIRVSSPAADLGIVAAVISGFSGKAMSQKSVFVGELGLLGEARVVVGQKRIEKEANRLGYSLQTVKNISQLK